MVIWSECLYVGERECPDWQPQDEDRIGWERKHTNILLALLANFAFSVFVHAQNSVFVHALNWVFVTGDVLVEYRYVLIEYR